MNRESWPEGLGPVLCVVGAHPNFIKTAPILRAFATHKPAIPALLIHTRQHYDRDMNDRLFEDLRLPHPDINLEAGLRSYDKGMQEGINRVLTDQVADLLYTTEYNALDNLQREGISTDRIHFAGNVMIDSLVANHEFARQPTEILEAAGFDGSIAGLPGGYAVVTLHRPSNVDQKETLQPLLEVLRDVSEKLPLVFALHPRTRGNIERFGLRQLVSGERIVLLPPQGYLEMLGLMAGARLVLTDSGGLQEETTALGIPCLTMRENTERPITVEQGTNTMVGRDRAAILAGVTEILSGEGKSGRVPELWDGRAAKRIASHLAGWLTARLGR